MRSITMNLREWALMLIMSLGGVLGGTLSVNMTTPTQCGHSIVRWSGDSGPYHLLLTPTEIQQHSYNIWVPTIPDGTNSYNISINEPAGLDFIITMWGASGIEAAGTTDIFTVGDSKTNDSSCFLSDAEILSLYTFSFNITTSTSFPAQCSNMSMTWPTSLENNVTSNVKRAKPEFHMLDSSSSTDKGNTTKPPTMFGIIPLGNSFSIPITYSPNSKFAQNLPASSLSNTPTTYTSQGVTHLNWTIDMAKGTRFLLVAGVGSDQEWASGGSSRMITVGQGDTSCVGRDPSGDGAPSVTATGTGDPAITATSLPDVDAGAPPSNGLTKTIVASVISIIGTLAAVGLLFLCWRVRKRRRAAAESQNGKGGFKAFIGKRPSSLQPLRTETQLDLISSRDSIRGLNGVAAVVTDSPLDSPVSTETTNPFRDPGARTPMYQPTRDGTLTSTPTSTDGTLPGRFDPRRDEMGRQNSTDPLLGHVSGAYPTRYPPDHFRPRGPLALHEPLAGEEVDPEENGDISDLKRETLSMGQPSRSTTMSPSSTIPPDQPPLNALPSLPLRTAPSVHSLPAPGQRRRRRQMEEEPSFVLHRDAGPARPVVELPPRYDQLNWSPTEEAEERERQTT